MPETDRPPSPTMREAIRRLQRGETVAAEDIVTRAALDARGRVGPTSAEYGAAENERGTLLTYLGQYRQAVEVYRAAAAVPPNAPDGIASQCIYRTNLGEALGRAGQWDEAEAVLRESAAEREKFYGADHPGYAAGLEALADLLLRRGKLDEALPAVESAVAIYWADGHPRIAPALALRAFVLKSAGVAAPAFADLGPLPDESIEELAQSVLERLPEADPPTGREVLAELLPLLSARFGDAHPVTLAVLATVANLERALGGTAARIAAIRRVIAVHDAAGDTRSAVQGVLGLAMAQSEGDQPEAALDSYREALERARAVADLGLEAQVLRNYGLCLAEMGRRGEAEPQLRMAVSRARAAGDAEALGRCQVALGIFQQHGGQLEPAADLLSEALRRLDPAHPDALAGRAHLEAIRTGGSCGCGDLGPTVANAFREYLLAQTPRDLVEDFDVTFNDGDLKVETRMARTPSSAEQERVERVVRHSLHQYRERLRRPV